MPNNSAASGTLLVYGAAGYIGSLLARAVLARGVRPVLAGRSGEQLSRFAGELGLEYRVAALDDEAPLDRILSGITVVLNAAGPFATTWTPLVDACLRGRVHYLDVTGEVAVFEGIRTRGAEARRRGVVLLPGVGFDVVPSDCLAAYVACRLPRARALRLAISGLELLSRGSARTLAELVGQPALVRREGRLVAIPHGSLQRYFDFGAGPSASVAVSWGDLATAFTTTGIPNIETYFEATPMVRVMVAAERFAGPLFAVPPARTVLETLTGALPDGPSAAERRLHSAVIVAEAEDAAGHVIRARLHTPEAYSFSAQTAAAIAGEVLAGNYEAGFQTPAGLYGSEYVMNFEGVSRETLASAA